MKGREIYKSIRKIYLRHLFWPLFPIIVSTVFIVIMPFKEMINPIKVSSTAEAIEAVKQGHEYIEISAEKLIYSGCNYMKDSDVYGEYYYDLVNGEKCVFFLIRPSDESETRVNLSNVTKTVKVVKTNGIFNNMLSMFSNTINWTEEGVREITEDYVLSEVDYHGITYRVLLVLLLITFAYGVAVFSYNLIFAIMPMLSPKLVVARYYYSVDKKHKTKDMDSFMRLVAGEMDNPKVHEENMYITEHFYINMDKSNFAIVPIDRIVLAYEHSTLKTFLGMHLNVSYTLCLKCTTMLRFNAPKKTHDEVKSILDYFRENEPGILVGYTDENKQLVKSIINKSTSWFRK